MNLLILYKLLKKLRVYDHLEQAGEINITPVKVEFKIEQLKRKGTLQNTELNPKARDFVPTKPKVNHHLNFPLLDLQNDRTMKEPTHDYNDTLYEEPSHFIDVSGNQNNCYWPLHNESIARCIHHMQEKLVYCCTYLENL
jgi:hypothetical protein